jgi:hypothetical protein
MNDSLILMDSVAFRKKTGDSKLREAAVVKESPGLVRACQTDLLRRTCDCGFCGEHFGVFILIQQLVEVEQQQELMVDFADS